MAALKAAKLQFTTTGDKLTRMEATVRTLVAGNPTYGMLKRKHTDLLRCLEAYTEAFYRVNELQEDEDLVDQAIKAYNALEGKVNGLNDTILEMLETLQEGLDANGIPLPNTNDNIIRIQAVMAGQWEDIVYQINLTKTGIQADETAEGNGADQLLQRQAEVDHVKLITAAADENFIELTKLTPARAMEFNTARRAKQETFQPCLLPWKGLWPRPSNGLML